MNLSNFGAVRLPFLAAAVLALLAAPVSSQVVEKGRTLADLIATHPCDASKADRIARVTDCDAADDIGDGGGAFQCWASCDGSAPWVTQAIGGGGGAGTIDGTLTATDNLIVRTDGTGGSTIQASPLSLSDVSGVTTTLATITPAATTGATVAGRALAITASPAVASTDTAGAAAGGSVTITAGAAARNASGNANGGDINLVTGAGIGTGTAGQVVAPVGSAASPSITFTGDTDTGIYRKVGDQIGVSTAGSEIAYFTTQGLALNGKIVSNVGGTINGFQRYTTQSTAGSGAPFALDVAYSFTVLTNEGSTAENYYTLPAASAGYQYTFIVQDTDGIRITATAGDTIRPIAGTAASATGGFIRCATAGAFITLVSINGTEWIAIGSAGVWTIDV